MTVSFRVKAASGATQTISIDSPVVAAPSVSLFTTQAPAQVNLTDNIAYELGTKFKASVSGKITAIRFWKGSQEGSGHVGKIYSAAGVLLVTVNFTGETASGWQQQLLPTPLDVAADATYVVSVNTVATGNRYVATTGGLSSAVVSGALSSIVGSNGVYGALGSMPTQSYQNSNYFRDVVFQQAPPAPDTVAPSAPTGLTALAVSSSQINIAWLASTDNVAVTEYRVSRNGAQVGVTTSLSYSDTGLIASTAYSYTVKAVDAAGNVSAASNTASATTQAAGSPPPSGVIPLTFNDAIFAAVTSSSSVSIPNGGSLAYKSITVDGPAASILCNGAATIDHVRVNSAEAVRVGGPGLVSISNSYLEAVGSGADHADVIQAYSPGDRGTIWIRNTSIVAHNTAATAGLFVADNWNGTIDLENVVFNGGPFGLRLHPDVGGDNLVYLKNVYFVGPFGYAPYLLSDYGGHRNIIMKWENVREATIVNGVLVPGALIPSP